MKDSSEYTASLSKNVSLSLSIVYQTFRCFLLFFYKYNRKIAKLSLQILFNLNRLYSISHKYAMAFFALFAIFFRHSNFFCSFCLNNSLTGVMLFTNFLFSFWQFFPIPPLYLISRPFSLPANYKYVTILPTMLQVLKIFWHP